MNMNQKENAAAKWFLHEMISRGSAEDAKLFAEAYANLMKGFEHRVMAESVRK